MNVPEIIEKLNLSFKQSNVDSRNELWMPCPLPFGNHKNNDRRPSFSINLDSGDSYCFVCGGGNLVWLISSVLSISEAEAKSWLKGAEEGKENFEDFRKRMKERLCNTETQSSEKLPSKIFSGASIPGDLPFHPWIENQGISRETARKFNIFYDAERNVIAFPHYWLGKLVGMQFRNLDWGSEDVRKKNWAKYFNTPGFPKKNTIFNYDSQDGDTIIVVESPKTVCVMDSRGYSNFVGTFGAGISYEQMAPLWKFKTIYLWPDNDLPGLNALDQEVKLLAPHADIYIVPPVDVPKGDAADLPADEMEGHLEKALPYLKWKLHEKIYQE